MKKDSTVEQHSSVPVTSVPAYPSETPQPRRVSPTVRLYPSTRYNLSSLISILEQAGTLGYREVNLSGTEPFLYRELEQLLEASKVLGFFNTVTTNGMQLQSDKARRVLNSLDLVTVSIEGKEKTHDALRGQQGDFARMLQGLQVLNDSVEQFGFIHTIRPDSWLIFPWLAEFALEHKARLLFLHPQNLSAGENLPSGPNPPPGASYSPHRFTDIDLYRIYISHYYLKSYFEPELSIRLDLLHRDNIIHNPDLAFLPNTFPSLKNFASLFEELAINENGDLLPISHGCSDFFRIGNINSGIPLEDMIERWINERSTAIMRLYDSAYQEIMTDKNLDIFNWNEKLIEKSHTFQPSR